MPQPRFVAHIKSLLSGNRSRRGFEAVQNQVRQADSAGREDTIPLRSEDETQNEDFDGHDVAVEQIQSIDGTNSPSALDSQDSVVSDSDEDSDSSDSGTLVNASIALPTFESVQHHNYHNNPTSSPVRHNNVLFIGNASINLPLFGSVQPRHRPHSQNSNPRGFNGVPFFENSTNVTINNAYYPNGISASQIHDAGYVRNIPGSVTMITRSGSRGMDLFAIDPPRDGSFVINTIHGDVHFVLENSPHTNPGCGSQRMFHTHEHSSRMPGGHTVNTSTASNTIHSLHNVTQGVRRATDDRTSSGSTTGNRDPRCGDQCFNAAHDLVINGLNIVSSGDGTYINNPNITFSTSGGSSTSGSHHEFTSRH